MLFPFEADALTVSQERTGDELSVKWALAKKFPDLMKCLAALAHNKQNDELVEQAAVNPKI
ncbi:MAG TPA: hypothetical protein DC054_04385 [Blastocatellia bacterium]|nr:hypothetical protein [Blastocatellia bacterium]